MPTLPNDNQIELPNAFKVRLTLRFSLPKIKKQKASRSFGIYWSESLGLGVLWPEPTDEELEAFYETEAYGAYLSGKEERKASSESLSDRLLRRIAQVFDKSDPWPAEYLIPSLNGSENVCDIGCGSGVLLKTLRPHCRSAYGIDPSGVSLDCLKSQGIEAFQGTAEELPREVLGKSFDLITMQHSLEHCRNPATALQNIRKICAPTGRLLIEVPNHENFGFSKYGPAWYHSDAGRHLHFFTARSLAKLASLTGWQTKEVGYFLYTRQFSENWIASMQNVWDNLYLKETPPGTRRAKKADRLIDLLCSATMRRPRRYEVLRVVLSPSGIVQSKEPT